MSNEPTSGDWIKWEGGECPVPPETIVEVRFRNGEVHGPIPSRGFDWKHEVMDDDIIAYRLARQP